MAQEGKRQRLHVRRRDKFVPINDSRGPEGHERVQLRVALDGLFKLDTCKRTKQSFVCDELSCVNDDVSDVMLDVDDKKDFSNGLSPECNGLTMS